MEELHTGNTSHMESCTQREWTTLGIDYSCTKGGVHGSLDFIKIELCVEASGANSSCPLKNAGGVLQVPPSHKLTASAMPRTVHVKKIRIWKRDRHKKGVFGLRLR